MSASEIELLFRVSSRLNSDLDINRVLAAVLDLTVNRVGASNGSILIFDERGSVAHKILARTGLPPKEQETVVARVLKEGLAGWIVVQRKGAVIDDVLSDARWITFEDDEFVDGSAIGVPLLRRERLVGVLTLRHREQGHFSESQLLLLTSIADQAAIAIENARLFYAAQSERARLQAVIGAAGDAILVLDDDGGVLIANAAARAAFGIPDRVPPGTPLNELIADAALGELWASRADGNHVATAEVPLSDSRTLQANLTRAPAVGYVIVMQDITSLKQLDRLKSDFVASVSHDLRSPLQLILTYTSLIAGSGPLTAQQERFVQGIDRTVRRMNALIEHLLDLARIEAGIDMERQECHLDDVIVDVLQRFKELAQRKGLELEVDLPTHLPAVRANVERIDQVVSNLVDNAIKYTPQGWIRVRAEADDGWVTVHVSDSGIGLKPQEQAGLFTRFYRADNEQTKHVEGTGLGLVMVKSIVEQYGGRVWVESRWQGGSTFSFALPRNDRG